MTKADGLIVVPLCESSAERQAALEFVAKTEIKERANWLVAVSQPLNSLSSLVQEVQRWEWISTNTLELNADKYAREEVSRQKAAARFHLEKRVQNFVGWKQLTGQMMLEWFYQGRPLKLKDGRYLLERVSTIFDEVYSQAPRIQNELVNRRSLSSAAAAARMRLIERMFTDSNKPLLGMDQYKKPPEMSMYLSVLKLTRLHQQHGESWRIGEPHHQGDACKVLPTLRKIREIVEREPDSRVNIAELFQELRRPPYGVRDGIIPLLLTVFGPTQSGGLENHRGHVQFWIVGSYKNRRAHRS